MRPSAPEFDFDEVLGRCRQSAVYLEMRDAYAVANETGRSADWKVGHRYDPNDRETWWRPWHSLIVETAARGVEVRRTHIESDPVSECLRFECGGTLMNVLAGELVRWLPRRQASDLALPGNDCWVFDAKTVRFGHFSGDGQYLDEERTEEPDVARLCSSAFESVWQRATPREEFKILSDALDS